MMLRLSKFCIILCALFAFGLNAHAQSSAVSTFTSKAFTRTSTATDTSATVNIGGYPFVSVSTTTVNGDSATITVTIDGLINGVWSNLLTSAAVQLGRPAGHTLASTKGQVGNFVLRDGSRIADLTQNCSQIRIRNVHAAYAAGSVDTATAYTQKVILRKS